MAMAKKSPGKLNFGSGSSSSRVAGELFRQMTGIDVVLVPYKSNPTVSRRVWSSRSLRIGRAVVLIQSISLVEARSEFYSVFAESTFQFLYLRSRHAV
jgi:hypothetical protein